MSSLDQTIKEKYQEFRSYFSREDPLRAAVDVAMRRIRRASEAGRILSPDVIDPILRLSRRGKDEDISQGEESEFFIAYSKLSLQVMGIGHTDDEYSGQPFENAVVDAEQLLNHAAAVGVSIPDDVVSGIIDARQALDENKLTPPTKASFYSAYTKLSDLLGKVSAETLRNCVSLDTRRKLAYLSYMALLVTAFVAVTSIFTFTTDYTSKNIKQQINLGNESAASLRTILFPAGAGTLQVEQKYFEKPCNHLDSDAGKDGKIVNSVDDITKLQSFATNVRDLRSNAIKLNSIVIKFSPGLNECDPFSNCPGGWEAPSPEEARKKLELNPTLKNYTAEALCKIQSYQAVRSFATNVYANYTALFGAFLSYALPIMYAFLGALAYRLRSFSEAIQKKTYQPSFSDTARIVTAVIAGAIAGLFNPAKGLEVSPLAVAFLVGYGVEIFFRFLDNLTNAFGAGASGTTKSSS